MTTYERGRGATNATPRYLSYWDNLLRKFERDWNGGQHLAKEDYRLLLLNDCIQIMDYQWAWQERELEDGGAFTCIGPPRARPKLAAIKQTARPGFGMKRRPKNK
jgi:hypothetical protein